MKVDKEENAGASIYASQSPLKAGVQASKLTCGPVPPPTCVRIEDRLVCTPPAKVCIAICDNPGECVVTCCESFAPSPVPAVGWAALVAVVIIAGIAGAIVRARRA